MKPKNVKVILQDEFRMNYVFTPPIHVQCIYILMENSFVGKFLIMSAQHVTTCYQVRARSLKMHTTKFMANL